MALSPAAERLYGRLSPLEETPSDSTALAQLATALGVPFEEAFAVARDSDTHRAFSMLLDPDAAPAWALPWLAQLPGVRLLPSDSEAAQRDRIRSAAGFYRGTVQALREAVLPLLHGTQYLNIIEKPSGRWSLTVVTRTIELPDSDQPRANASTNPNGETGATTGWLPRGLNDGPGSFVATTEQARYYTHSFKLTRDAGEGAATTEMWAQQQLAVAAGKYVGVRASFRAATVGRGCRILIDPRDSGNASLGLQQGTGINDDTGAWTDAAFIYSTPMPAGTTTVVVRPQINAVPYSESHYIGGVMVVISDHPITELPAYGDGGFATWVWDGTAHLSASHRVPTSLVATAAKRQKPAGVKMTLLSVAEPIVDEGTLAINSVPVAINAPPTVDDVT